MPFKGSPLTLVPHPLKARSCATTYLAPSSGRVRWALPTLRNNKVTGDDFRMGLCGARCEVINYPRHQCHPFNPRSVFQASTV